MRFVRASSVVLLVALSVGATACSDDSESAGTTSTDTTTSTDSGSSALPIAKRGVVTIPMATVGDPGNPSVGVWRCSRHSERQAPG
jgi:hypothetical protein